MTRWHAHEILSGLINERARDTWYIIPHARTVHRRPETAHAWVSCMRGARETSRRASIYLIIIYALRQATKLDGARTAARSTVMAYTAHTWNLEWSLLLRRCASLLDWANATV